MFCQVQDADVTDRRDPFSPTTTVLSWHLGVRREYSWGHGTLSGLKWTVLGAGAGTECCWAKPVGPAREVSCEQAGRALALCYGLMTIRVPHSYLRTAQLFDLSDCPLLLTSVSPRLVCFVISTCRPYVSSLDLCVKISPHV